MEIISKKICIESYVSRKEGNWGQFSSNDILLQILISQSYDDMGIFTINSLDWIPGKRYYKGDYVNYDGKTWVLESDSYSGEYNEEYEELTFDTETPSHWKEATGESFPASVSAETSSKLSALRRSRFPRNEDGSENLPDINSDEDWLILYMPDLVVNVSGTTEEYIEDKKRKVRMINATGDMIESVDIDTANHTIKFVYEIGMHLEDETLSPLPGTGIKYTDEYQYDEENFSFDGDYDNLSMDNLGIFRTTFVRSYVDKRIGSDYASISHVNSLMEYMDGTPNSHITYHKDEYLMNITYNPVVDKDINVDRGVNAAFERHLKLGEVKTLEDMELYGNGYFNLKSDE